MTATECCRKGHPYTEENLRIVIVHGAQVRQCRICDKERAQAKRDAARGDRPKFKKKQLAEECFRGHPLSGDNLYFYETKWGTQRRCRACEEIRRLERIANATVTIPTKTHCFRGHALEGDNVSFRADGFAICKKCAVIRTMKYKNASYDEFLDAKTRNRRAAKDVIVESARGRILAIYAADLADDELIRQLREALPPAET